MTEPNARGTHGPDGFGATYDGIVICGGARTPFGDLSGSLALVSPTDLGVVAARAALAAARCEAAAVDQVVFASVAQAGPDAYYFPRHVGLYAGVPRERPAILVQRICASGLEVVIQAAEQIALGKADVVLCGGAESMSRNPVASYDLRGGFTMGQPNFVDTLWAELFDPAPGCSMGETAENLAKDFGFTRNDTDTYALDSQARYAKARNAGFFAGEITPVRPGKLEAEGVVPRNLRITRGVAEVTQDEHPRETTMEALGKLKPSFRPDGVQTPGNCSGIGDGAAALVIASESAAQRLGLPVLARIVASASNGVEPSRMGIGPVPSIRMGLGLTGWKLPDLDAIEVNEAFAAQCLAVRRELDADPLRFNPNGGAIAVGHPLAATGARLALTLTRHLLATGKRRGVASVCVGGGQGTALFLEAQS